MPLSSWWIGKETTPKDSTVWEEIQSGTDQLRVIKPRFSPHANEQLAAAGSPEFSSHGALLEKTVVGEGARCPMTILTPSPHNVFPSA